MENDRKLCEKIRALRRKSGLSQEELAEKLDVSRQAVSKWELGAAVPSPDKLVDISDLFGVTLDRLMRDVPLEFSGSSEFFEEKSSEDYEDVPEKTSKYDALRGWLRKAFGGGLIGVAVIVTILVIVLHISGLGGSVSGSSLITVDGTGAAVIFSVVSAAVGFVLLILPRK